MWPATRKRRATVPGEPELEPLAIEDLDRDEGEADDPDVPGPNGRELLDLLMEDGPSA